jgi:hypothetical protein
MPAFKQSPNVFDQFVLMGQPQAEATAQQAGARGRQERSRAQHAEVRDQQAETPARQSEIRAQQADASAQQEASPADRAETRAQQATERTAIETRRVEQAETRTTCAAAALEAPHNELQNVQQANHHHFQVAEAQHQQIRALPNSASWRITAPLRRVGVAVRGSRLRAMKLRVKVSLHYAAAFVSKHRRLRIAALRVLNRFPRLKSRLLRVIVGTPTFPVHPQNVPSDVPHLTPRARQIYADLEAAIEQVREDT